MLKLFDSVEEEEMIRECDEQTYLNMKAREKLLNDVFECISKGKVTFVTHPGREIRQEGILHPCTKGTAIFQFSFFDELGPIGDFERNTWEEVAKSVVEYGFIPIEVEDLVFLS
jgi:hypothetical protein